MVKCIKLRNFQSLKLSTLQLPPGVKLIKKPVHKSKPITKPTKVSIEFHDGTIITREKRK